MAVPKKRTGASAQGHRRSNWKATKPATTTCSKCGAIVLAHTVCTECGYYKGKPASIKHENYSEAVVESKPAKKETKKAEVKEETTDLSKLTVAELRDMAKEKGISGVSTMKKAELLDALK